jgi:hypothetical protein
MIMSKIEDLEFERARCQQELEELHIYEPSEDWYKTRRHDLEYTIACIDEAIEEEMALLREDDNDAMRLAILLLAIIVMGLGILIFTV